MSTALESRVHKGQDLRYEVHNFLVMLDIYGSIVTTCTGSIISNNWIITAAHCVKRNFQKLIVYHGTREGIKQIAVVKKFETKIHPEYTNQLVPAHVGRDVALIYLRQQLQFNTNINSIILADFYPKIDETGIIAGYGEKETYLNAPREGTVVITESNAETGIICSHGPSRVGFGDSGGPLIVRERLAGVISMTCKNTSIVLTCKSSYASVATNLNWIRLITNSIV